MSTHPASVSTRQGERVSTPVHWRKWRTRSEHRSVEMEIAAETRPYCRSVAGRRLDLKAPVIIKETPMPAPTATSARPRSPPSFGRGTLVSWMLHLSALRFWLSCVKVRLVICISR